MQWGNPIFMAAMQNLVTEFNRTHPEIHVNFTQLSWGDYMQKILAAVEAGNPPDVSGGDSGIPFTMNAQGQALPLNDVFKQWQKDGTFKDMSTWAYKKWE
jgi:multiple sugar transport system substrate-binding protein